MSSEINRCLLINAYISVLRILLLLIYILGEGFMECTFFRVAKSVAILAVQNY